MNIQIHSLILIFLFPLVQLMAQPFAVGSRTFTYNDPARTGGFGSGGGPGRQIQSELYYPANSAGVNASVASGSFPVIVFGHGFVMAWDSYKPVYDSLARNGYVVVLPRTEGDIGPSHTDFAKDLALVLDKTLLFNSDASSPFFGKLNGRGAIGGHSMGGGSTFLANQYTTQARCYFTFAAANTNPSAIAMSNTIQKPHLVISGEHDCVAPPANHQDGMYDNLSSSCKVQVTINDAMHCQFNANNVSCNFGEQSLFCFQQTVNRDSQLRATRKFLNPWLDYYLKGNCDAYNEFQSHLAASFGVTVRQSCSENIPASASITGDSVFCTGSSANLQASPTGFSYQWSNSTTTQNNSVNTPGNYSVTVSNGVCSRVSSPFAVSVKNVPATPLSILGSDTICNNISDWDFRVDPVQDADFYTWSVPGTIIDITQDSMEIIAHNLTSGIISVAAGNECGFGQPLQMNLVVFPAPVTGLVRTPVSICEGETQIQPYVVSENGVTYNWTVQGNGWSVASGQGTANLVLNVGTTNAQLSLLAENDYCNHTEGPITITVIDTPQLVITPSSDTLFTNPAFQNLEWFLDGNSIGMGSFWIPSSEGVYTCLASDNNGCNGWSTPFTWISIQGVMQNSIIIYPNPATDVLHIHSLSDETFFINSVEGKTLQTFLVKANETYTLNIQSLAAGMYLIKSDSTVYKWNKLK